MESTVIWVSLWFVIMFLAVGMARARARNPWIWALVCAFLTLPGLALLYACGRKEFSLTPEERYRWKLLKHVDPDIAAAAAKAQEFGAYNETVLASLYLGGGDHRYLKEALRRALGAPKEQIVSLKPESYVWVPADNKFIVTKGKNVGNAYETEELASAASKEA